MQTEPQLLYVEDDENLRNLMREALHDLGYHVITADDGPQAVCLMETGAFDIVFSDVSMPNGMSGIELVAHATRLQPNARIILASGYAKAQLPPIPEGVAFLPKPYRIPQLIAVLTEVGCPAEPRGALTALRPG